MKTAPLRSLAAKFEAQLPSLHTNPAWLAQPINQFIDHTLLKPEATPAQIDQLCQEAAEYHFAAVCINGIYVDRAAAALKGTTVKVCTVVGFPLGAVPTKIKVAETREYIRRGAVEIDMVIPIGLLKAGETDAVLQDITAVVRTANANGAIVKVIIETALLTHAEKIMASLLTLAGGAQFVKTSTGFGPGGATPEDVELMRRVVGSPERIGVKAAGGVRSLADARNMLTHGANRLGTSAGVKIMQELAASA